MFISHSYTGTIVMQIIGLIVFVKQCPNPMPSIFGYHEIFHLFVVIAGKEILVYLEIMLSFPLFAVDISFHVTYRINASSTHDVDT